MSKIFTCPTPFLPVPDSRTVYNFHPWVGCPQGYKQIFTSLQRCLWLTCKIISTRFRFSIPLISSLTSAGRRICRIYSGSSGSEIDFNQHFRRKPTSIYHKSSCKFRHLFAEGSKIKYSVLNFPNIAMQKHQPGITKLNHSRPFLRVTYLLKLMRWHSVSEWTLFKYYW